MLNTFSHSMHDNSFTVGEIEKVGADERGRVAVVGVPELVLCPLGGSARAVSLSAARARTGVAFERVCDTSRALER